MNVYSVPGHAARIHIEIDLPQTEVAAFLAHARNKKRATSNKLIPVVREIANSDYKRGKRDGYIQTEVPKSLRASFEEISRMSGFRSGQAYLRNYLMHYVDPSTGKRKKDKKGRHLHPSPPDAFASKGRDLIRQAKREADGKPFVRYTFDARKSKLGIIELADARGINLQSSLPR